MTLSSADSPMSTILIGLSPEAVCSRQKKALESLTDGMRVVITEDSAEMSSVAPHVEIAAGKIDRDHFAEMPRLKWFQQWGAGADWITTHTEIRERDLVITNASGIHSIQMSEHIMMYLLAFARWLPSAIRAQITRTWTRPPNHDDVFELAGKTILIVGVGAIGGRTAEIANALGMRVIGVRRNGSVGHPSVHRMVGQDALHDALPEADFVAVTVPATVETIRMFGGKEFAQMKDTAYFVNVGRGKTVDQAALIHALQNGIIAGAGLDVFDPEPLPADSPLWDMENVIITCHYSGHTPLYDERAMDVFLENLRRYRNGEELVNVVDKDLGY
jgi:D-2-hydroxyacid dehydrogenase (NADP+)